MTSEPRPGPDGIVSADRRIGPLVAMAVGGLLAGLITGQAAFVAVAAPAAVLAGFALADRRPLAVEVVSVTAPTRLLDGDRWTLEVELRWTGHAVLDILHTGLRGSTIDGPAGWRVDAVDHAVVVFDAVADRWGLHDLGTLVIRARRVRGMLRWDGTIPLAGTIRVLPSAGRLDALLHPAVPRAAAGSHVAPVRGAGTDFAELRQYQPGDRLRDLSWSATARSDRPWVVEHHPERTGTVVLLLDAFVEAGGPRRGLDRAAKVVWSIARAHLAAGDRVGLASVGAHPVWLPAAAGRRARWQVLDALLAVGGTVAGGRSGAGRAGRDWRDVRLPADAVVVGVTPLESDGFVHAVGHQARLGHPTRVIGIRTDDLLDAPGDEVERAARRLWSVDRELRRATLRRAGIPSTIVVDDASPAVRLLGRKVPA